MDINNPVSFNHKTAFVNGINIRVYKLGFPVESPFLIPVLIHLNPSFNLSPSTDYVDQNPESQNVILCVHGWPDLWYGWRHQIVHLANKGYRVIAPDLRGFGETVSADGYAIVVDAPASSSEYGYGTVSTDLVRLLDHLSIPQVILLGHDWGGLVVWRMTAFYPDRVKAVASFCTPYIPPTDKSSRDDVGCYLAPDPAGFWDNRLMAR
ncbi:Alpha/Beta hydrolase protein [Jimgerdemannia flammicorona]|uniref:Alpha/Beta hydrolase protein n=1 Tax=Jimgerdemannia flammicorona TaxID=994334 RepID=A0A433CXI4_9FUNG|nr:Alpha/Beta hydrolase protein [Jimgerdemannia flammicorona]